MRIKKPLLLFISSFLVLLCCLNSHALAATDGIGFVAAIRGKVSAVNIDGRSRGLSLKDEVFQADTIKTGKRSRIQLMFIDNSLISLGRNSEMKLTEYSWDKEKKTGVMKTEIKEGVFRVMGGAITKASPENFATKTPTATIGIRGSMYAGKTTADSLSVVFQGGKGIDITNPAGTVSITKPGFGTFVTLNEAPQMPTKFTVEDMADLNAELAGGEEETTDEGTPEGTDDTEPADEEQPADEEAADEGAPPEEEAADESQPTEEGAEEQPADETAGDEEGTAIPEEEGEQLPPDEDAPPPEDEQPPPEDQPPPDDGTQPPPPDEDAPPPPDGTLPPPDEDAPPPPDGALPPPDGDAPPPPDGTLPPPPDSTMPPPPDGTLPP
ncbi:MAG: FecR domain-containing protein, partial [Desulfobulbaceae bacterium]|nr:FecR domain-containing protein [Desulfobulbaceae bacterium]